MPVGEVHNIEDLAGILGCGISSLLTKYLGLPPCVLLSLSKQELFGIHLRMYANEVGWVEKNAPV